MKRPAAERFWEKVHVAGPDDCWLWTAGTSEGYGNFHDGAAYVRAHRFAYTTIVGPVPAGLCVLHSCDVRRCVNPAHFFLGTRADNAADRQQKGRGRNGRSPGEQNGSARLTASDVQSIRRLLADGNTIAAISQEIGVSNSTISHIANEDTWSHLPWEPGVTREGGYRVGERHGGAKLSNEDVQVIRLLSAEGWTQDAIARQFAVGRRAIGRILNGTRWAHLPWECPVAEAA